MTCPNHSHKRLLARLHFWVLGCSLLGYLALVFTLGPGFLSFDVNKKIRALADELIVVTAIVLGPPATPVVTATPSCVSGAPRITLDWADDAATTSWDIERDGNPLTTGLTSSSYGDTAVTGAVSYSYAVTAYGPMSPGSATSTAVSATAIDCSTLLPAATLTLTRLGGKNITPPRSLPIKIEESRPRIIGNTNVANALVDITLTRPSISTRITTNANGYFSWKPPRALRVGRHTLTVAVTDPNDSSRTTSETLEFFTKAIPQNDDEEEQAVGLILTEAPFDFTLTWLGALTQIEQGERIEFMLRPVRGLFPRETVFTPSFINKQGEVVWVAPSQTVTPEGRPGLSWSLDTPLYLPEGEYTLQVEALMNEVSISRSVAFHIEAKPLFQIGNRHIITLAEIGSIIGWLLFFALGIFTFALLFLLREYWLYLQSVRHITERELRRFGMIALRKEVRKQ